MGYGSGGGGGDSDDGGFHYSYTDHAYEDANGNIVGWDYVFNDFVLHNAAYTINFTDLTAFGTDANPYQYFSLWVNGKRWNSSDGLGALQNMIDDALQGSGINISGEVGGGTSLPSSINWANNGASIAAYGANMVGGSVGFVKSGSTLRWYANTWRGNQYVETYNLAELGSHIGYGTSFLGTGIGIADFMLSDKSWGDYGQLGVSIFSAALTIDGVTAPAGIGIGIFDATGGFNSFYNFLDINQQLYNNTGVIMLPPVIGLPQFLP